MKTQFMVLLTLFSTITMYSQTIDTNYFPPNRGNVTDSLYQIGRQQLEAAYKQTKYSDTLNYVDYWNVALSFAKMGVDKDILLQYLTKSKSLDKNSFCKYVKYLLTKDDIIENLIFYKTLGIAFTDLINDCELDHIKLERKTVESMNKIKSEMDLKGLNEKLIDRLIICMEKDQRYRYRSDLYRQNWKKQTLLDNEVQEELTKIFEEFGYPGKNLVGSYFMNFASNMILHGGELAYLEKYLPMFAEAYQKGQLNKVYLIRLIDRVYWRQTGKQIFGTHSGIPFDTDEIKAKIKRKYGLN